jgi:hypothetical protein
LFIKTTSLNISGAIRTILKPDQGFLHFFHFLHTILSFRERSCRNGTDVHSLLEERKREMKKEERRVGL